MNVGVGRLRKSATDRICQARWMIAGSKKVTLTRALVGRKSRAPRMLLRGIVKSRGFEPGVWSAWPIVYPNVSVGRQYCADTSLSLRFESVEHGSHSRVRNIMAPERKRCPRK